MIELITKQDQFNGTLFNGRFHVNKPVASGNSPLTAPFSNLFYWSHAMATDDCGFGMHPHEGFEIMTFILEGSIIHYDTVSQVWTPLHTGDFQIIRSGRGLEHAERISKGTRSFQIWFDPDIRKAIGNEPSYTDHHANEFPSTDITGGSMVDLVGGTSPANADTEGLRIRRVRFNGPGLHTVPLPISSCSLVYFLDGEAHTGDLIAHTNDVLRVVQEGEIHMSSPGALDLFVLSVPEKPSYAPVWTL